VLQSSCSYSLQVFALGTTSCTTPMNLRTTLTAVQSYITLLMEARAMFRAKHTLSGRISISTVCSLQFLAVNRNNLKAVFSVRRVVLTIKYVAFYGVLLQFILNIFFIFRLLIYLTLRYLDRQKSKTIRPIVLYCIVSSKY